MKSLHVHFHDKKPTADKKASFRDFTGSVVKLYGNGWALLRGTGMYEGEWCAAKNGVAKHKSRHQVDAQWYIESEIRRGR